jgi:hypothetical protein
MIEPQIIDFLKKNGPSTPAQFAKYANITLLFASAMLGDVVSKGLARTSHLKIGGGSPLYYLQEQREKLQNFSNRLGSKERQLYEELKAKLVLRESDLNPLGRLSLRTIKDFSVPIKVKISGQEEVFWRWYLLDQKEAEKIVRDLIARKDAEMSEHEIEHDITEKKEIQQQLSPSPKEVAESAVIGSDIKNDRQTSRKNNSLIQADNEIVKEKRNIDTINKERISNNAEGDIEKETLNPDNKIASETADLASELSIKFTTTSSKKIIELFKDKAITILKYDVVKKNKEYTLIITVPSPIGRINCYAKILDKKKITEGEVALFIVETQNKGMPGVLITTKEGIKKIEDKFNKDFKAINLIAI